VTSAAIGVDQLWYDVPGGVGTYIRNLVPAVLDRDPSLDVRLFHATFERPDPSEQWMQGRRVITIRSGIRTLYPRWNTAGRPALPPPLASADVLHATSGVAIPPRARGQALIVTIHDLAFLRYPQAFARRWRALYRLGLRAAARRADAILVPSRSTARDVVEATSVPDERVHVTPLASDTEVGTGDPEPVLERLGIRRPFLLFVGTLEPRKNLVTLVRAYRAAARNGLEHALVLAGADGWGLDELAGELAAGGPGSIVRTGFVPSSDLDALYRGAGVFVYPSLYEGFGLPVLEAMARGVPVVTSDASSLPEVAGDAAILVDPRSTDQLEDAIVRIAGDPDLASRLSTAGVRRAAAFTWDETARLTLAAYDAAQRS
jgi:glycosyltransferase involved in cell wall biosynthesis